MVFDTQTHVYTDSTWETERGDTVQYDRLETLYHRDDALLYIAYVMLIWTAPIPADRWHCSPW